MKRLLSEYEPSIILMLREAVESVRDREARDKFLTVKIKEIKDKIGETSPVATNDQGDENRSKELALMLTYSPNL